MVSQVLTLRSSLQASQSYLSTAQNVQGWLDANDGAYSGLVNLANNALTSINRGLNDTMSDEDRKNTLAPELDAILHNAVDLGNATYQGKFIFSGARVDTPAFTYDDTTHQVTYNPPVSAATDAVWRDLGPGQKIQINATGDQSIKPLIDAITEARDALDPPGPNPVFDRAKLAQSLTDLKAAMDTVTRYQTQNGVHQRQATNFIDQMQSSQTELKSLISGKEDVNMAESIMLLQQQQTVYQAVLEVGQRAISTMNLFSYLQ